MTQVTKTRQPLVYVTKVQKMVGIDMFSSKNLKTLWQFYLTNPHRLHQFTNFGLYLSLQCLKLGCREQFWL